MLTPVTGNSTKAQCNTLEGILNRGLTISHLNVRRLRNQVDLIS